MPERDDEIIETAAAEETAPRRRLLELDPEHGWYGTICGVTAGLIALWALSV